MSKILKRELKVDFDLKATDIQLSKTLLQVYLINIFIYRNVKILMLNQRSLLKTFIFWVSLVSTEIIPLNCSSVNSENRVESGEFKRVKGRFQPKSYKYSTLQNSLWQILKRELEVKGKFQPKTNINFQLSKTLLYNPVKYCQNFDEPWTTEGKCNSTSKCFIWV